MNVQRELNLTDVVPLINLCLLCRIFLCERRTISPQCPLPRSIRNRVAYDRISRIFERFLANVPYIPVLDSMVESLYRLESFYNFNSEPFGTYEETGKKGERDAILFRTFPQRTFSLEVVRGLPFDFVGETN